MPFFDYDQVAAEAGITDDELEQICAHFRTEFPGDDMMADLHILRACNTVLEGAATVEQVLVPQTADAAKA
jgi:hypothetical protein